MKETVLVTGAGGFIGSHLTERLAREGYEVRAMVHYNSTSSWGWLEDLDSGVLDHVKILAGDVRDPFAVSRAVKGTDRVFHLAALIGIPYSYHAPASYVDTNVTGTLNVLEACREHGVGRLVHTSTSETYGTARYTPMDEQHPLVGQSPYSASKIAADKLVESYFLSFGLPVATLRPFNTFGPRQSARAVIPTVITQALAGHSEIRLGSLDPVRDLNYVEDTVAGFLAVAQSDSCLGGVFNCGRGSGVAIGDLARTILDICSSKACIVCEDERVRPENSEVRELVCDNTRLAEAANWFPAFSLEQGLARTVEWFRHNAGLYKETIYNI